jgi:hypothetical protein
MKVVHIHTHLYCICIQKPILLFIRRTLIFSCWVGFSGRKLNICSSPFSYHRLVCKLFFFFCFVNENQLHDSSLISISLQWISITCSVEKVMGQTRRMDTNQEIEFKSASLHQSQIIFPNLHHYTKSWKNM